MYHHGNMPSSTIGTNAHTYLLSRPGRLRYDLGARYVACHGNTVLEVCQTIHSEAMRTVATGVLNLDTEYLMEYALGPAWQPYSDILHGTTKSSMLHTAVHKPGGLMHDRAAL